MSGTDYLVGIQANIENGGLSNPTPGELWDRTRLEGYIEFLSHQIEEHAVSVVLQQEGCFYHANGRALLHEIEAAVGLRGFITPGERAERAGRKSYPTVVWIDPVVVTPIADYSHTGGLWWHSATELRGTAFGHALTLVSAHLNVASPALRDGEGAALTMIHGHGELILGVDANSARGTGRAQSMDMVDQVHHAHRSVGPDRPDEADRAVARYLEYAGLVEAHTHVGTPEALRWTTGHRPHQAEREGGGSHADHVYVSPALADGRVGRITDCIVISEQEYPGIEAISDHLPTRFTLAFPRSTGKSQ